MYSTVAGVVQLGQMKVFKIKVTYLCLKAEEIEPVEGQKNINGTEGVEKVLDKDETKGVLTRGLPLSQDPWEQSEHLRQT